MCRHISQASPVQAKWWLVRRVTPGHSHSQTVLGHPSQPTTPIQVSLWGLWVTGFMQTQSMFFHSAFLRQLLSVLWYAEQKWSSAAPLCIYWVLWLCGWEWLRSPYSSHVKQDVCLMHTRLSTSSAPCLITTQTFCAQSSDGCVLPASHWLL